jgi:hypothetical protein
VKEIAKQEDPGVDKMIILQCKLFTQPLTEIRTRNRKIIGLGSGARPDHKADCLDNVGALTSHKALGLRGLLRGQMEKCVKSKRPTNGCGKPDNGRKLWSSAERVAEFRKD